MPVFCLTAHFKVCQPASLLYNIMKSQHSGKYKTRLATGWNIFVTDYFTGKEERAQLNYTNTVQTHG